MGFQQTANFEWLHRLEGSGDNPDIEDDFKNSVQSILSEKSDICVQIRSEMEDIMLQNLRLTRLGGGGGGGP